MQFLLLIVVYVVCSFIWYYPIYRKQESSKKVPKKYYIQSFLWGTFPAFIVAVLAECAVSGLSKLAGMTEDDLAYHAIIAFIAYALCEELTKYLFARIAIRKLENLRRVDIVLLFGMVGIGFEIFEGFIFIATSGLAAVVIRSILALHIVCQFFMGYFYYDALTCKQSGDIKGYRRYLSIAIIIPTLVHGLHDFAGEMVKSNGGIDVTGPLGVATDIILVLCIIADIAFIISAIKKAHKSAVESASL